MTEIPEDHPRYRSLLERERIVRGVESGITSIKGLIAQGRGEAFDYLLGEATIPAAREAQYAAAAMLMLAESPVISVNGNTAALVPDELIELSALTGAPLEVNLFYWTRERVQKIIEYLQAKGAKNVLGAKQDAEILGLSSDRRKVCSEGIFSADVVFVPLEDGDRCEALMGAGKKVIAVDLNPLSRTARCATITIVDNITRTMPALAGIIRNLKGRHDDYLQEILKSYDNSKGLEAALKSIKANLEKVKWSQ